MRVWRWSGVEARRASPTHTVLDQPGQYSRRTWPGEDMARDEEQQHGMT